jgi:NAD(P)H dehydrogenase (quinone)
MNIGLLVHSYTGNTLSVIEKLRAALLAAGFNANIERVVAKNEDPAAAASIELAASPDATGYDLLVFAAPVRAFSLSPVMKLYLSRLPALTGKNVCLLVTEFFPFAWMGGNRAIKQMRQLCTDKGCSVLGTGVINWSSLRRDKQIAGTIERLIRRLAAKAG